MSKAFRGPIGLIVRCPILSLAMSGSILIVISLMNLAIVRFVGTGSPLVRPGMYGWPSVGSIPLPFIMLAGIFGLATGTAMLIAAAYLSGLRTKSRLIGCALAGVGSMTIAVGLYEKGVGWMLGILFIGIGGVILSLARQSPASSDSG